MKKGGEAIFSAASGCIWAGLVFGGLRLGLGWGFVLEGPFRAGGRVRVDESHLDTFFWSLE